MPSEVDFDPKSPYAPKVKVKLLHPNAKLPTRSYAAAGYDLYAVEDTTIPEGQVVPVKIGIAIEFLPCFAALFWDRSGMGKKGLHIFGGVIDEDYRGELMVLLHNSTRTDYFVKAGDRVGQFLLQPVMQYDVEQVEELSSTERGEARWSSTGK